MRARDEAEIETVAVIRKAFLGRPYRRTKTTTETWVERRKGDAEPIEHSKTVTVVEEGEDHDWRAGMALLERQHRDRWGKTHRHEVTGSEGGPLELDVATKRERARVAVESVRERIEALPSGAPGPS